MLSATISPENACGRVWDVVVIGAGPAGALAARETARMGRRTLLVDRAAFPRSKVCGCCLSARALGVLERVGLGNLAAALGARRLEALALRAGEAHAVLRLPGGAALSRRCLDGALVAAAIEAGAEFLPETQAHVGSLRGDAREIALRHAALHFIARTRVALLADGLGGGAIEEFSGGRGIPAKGSRIGAGAMLDDRAGAYATGLVHMACGRAGYVGLVRVEGEALAMAAAFDPAGVERSGGLAEAALAILNENRMPIPEGMRDAPWRGTPLLTRRAVAIAAPRVLVLGDAAGYVEPFTGEGMAWALESGEAAAPLAHQGAAEWSARLERAWTLRQARVWRAQRLCRGVAWLLRRPRATRWAVAALQRAPRLATPLILHAHRATAPVREPGAASA